MVAIAAYAVFNGATIGGTVVAVLHAGERRGVGLTPFQQALIIALISSIVGALGMVLAAMVSARVAREAIDAAHRTAAGVEDLKRAQGLGQREGDG